MLEEMKVKIDYSVLPEVTDAPEHLTVIQLAREFMVSEMSINQHIKRAALIPVGKMSQVDQVTGRRKPGKPKLVYNANDARQAVKADAITAPVGEPEVKNQEMVA